MALVGVLLDQDCCLSFASKGTEIHSMELVLIIEVLTELAIVQRRDTALVKWSLVSVDPSCSLRATVSSHSDLSFKLNLFVYFYIH